MGKGDIKSKKGKIANGTYGNSRRKKKQAATVAAAPAKPAAKVGKK
ncbi:MAG: 30S ribosomal protein THX [Cytophagales bacterium]|jgi:ribosomal small subunit protein bTHX|nr:30S ribosomal protein THX [Cytophagales bacterium]